MMKHLELKPEQLKKHCPLTIFEEDIICRELEEDEIIGQKRAMDALEFGFKINRKGYNIFVTGMPGTGRNSYVHSLAKKLAKTKTIPDDWCYVYNYDKPENPRAIRLNPGEGKEFQKAMESFITRLQADFPKVFSSKEYEEKKNSIYIEFDKRNNKLLEELNEIAEEYSFEFQMTESGLISYPLIEGRPLTEKDMNEMEEDQIDELRTRSVQLNSEAYDLIKKIRNLETELRDRLKDISQNMASSTIDHHMAHLQEAFGGNKAIDSYLKATSEDIINNIPIFMGNTSNKEDEFATELFFIRYKINLFIDNSELKEAPVIKELNPNYYNLLGKIEYVNERNYLRTDHTRIKPGSLHMANGGYMILQAKDLLVSPYAWAGIKRALVSCELQVENIASKGTVIAETIKPEPIPIELKVIIIGDSYVYQMLYYNDEDFKKLFKIKADFDVELARTEENMKKLANFVAGHCKREKVRKFTKEALAHIVEYSSRMAENQEKLTARFNEIVEVIYEAEALSEFEESEIVTRDHIRQAIEEKIKRNNKYEERLLEMIKEGTIMIQTEGQEIGQINGLAVLDSGQYSFGRPSKITASTFVGEEGILNIEREVNQSGDIHDKGVLILQGYIGHLFAQKFPISMTASITFEQSYGMIDGDSASSTELYALLSSLSEVPINQHFAVTGSVNQKGFIQPIGGVNQKIEGFYKVCKMRGLKGDEGVLIPIQNVKDLMLNDEVIEAVRQGKFHIYPVETIDQGIEILTGKTAGKRKSDGSYPKGSINYLVQEKLEYYANLRKDFE